MDVVHTDLSTQKLDIVSPETLGLIYYFPEKLDLSNPLIADVGVRLQATPDGINVESFTYLKHQHTLISVSFTLFGTVGCTAAVNLGFFLLEEFTGKTMKQLGLLILLDHERLSSRFKLDLPVDDDAIITFCQERGTPFFRHP